MRVSNLRSLLEQLDEHALVMMCPGDEGEKRVDEVLLMEGVDDAEIVVFDVRYIDGRLTFVIEEPHTL